MFSAENYQLLDFGRGRKLERFGPFVLDRPSPAAETAIPARPDLWRRTTARYDRTESERGRWSPAAALPKTWTVQHGPISLQLQPTPFGHLGVFPEQAANWDWLAAQISAADRPLRLLNLFAHTGGSTLVAAAAGAEVVHLDAARNVVQWARRNAELSQLSATSIRWIAEDAMKFVEREVRRGNRYDAIVLDPPSFGRGPQGQRWQLEEDLPRLLQGCRELTGGRPRLLLASCHAPRVGAQRLRRMLAAVVRDEWSGRIAAEPLSIRTASGAELAGGVVARFADQPIGKKP